MPGNFEMLPLEIGNLPMFNQDFDDESRTPAEWENFRKEVKRMDGFLFVTPEYNRSVTPVLKNALDIASRPFGCNVWDGKPGAVLSISVGKLGGFGANHALRQVLVYLNVLLMQQPEAYVGEVAALLDNNGEITNPGTKQFLSNFASAFARWVGKVRG
jgi:chromate reductase